MIEILKRYVKFVGTEELIYLANELILEHDKDCLAVIIAELEQRNKEDKEYVKRNTEDARRSGVEKVTEATKGKGARG